MAASADRRTLLIVSKDERFVSPSLAHAIRHEFPWLDVSLVTALERVSTAAVHIVPLILIDLNLFEHYERMIGELRRAHPQAAVAFLAGGIAMAKPSEILSCANVRGVLSMSLALDVWLAAVRVLMLGGEYFSSAFLLAAVDRKGPASMGAVPCREVPPALRGLTAREAQILELVARGQQNKLIASVLNLSENTVKIHIHHIIAKLGVHNRTEAASFYLEGRRSIRGDHAGAPSIDGTLP